MSSGVAPSEALQGAPWVQAALQESLGTFGPVFITVSMVLFAFTTLLGNCFYCDNLLTFLSNTTMKALKDYERQLKMGMNPVFKSKDIGMKEKLDCWK